MFADPNPAFAAEFPAASAADWRRLVDGVLKGAPFERRLVSRTVEGIPIVPLHERDAGAEPILAARGAGPWRVAALVDHPDAEEANRLALADLEGGADQLVLAAAGSLSGRGFGLSDWSEAGLARALAGVEIDLIRLELDPPALNGARFARQIASLCRARRLVPAALSIDFGLRPLADWARRGTLSEPWPALAAHEITAALDLRQAGFSGPFFVADGRPFHEAGAGDAQELACLLAQATTYLRLLTAAGVAISEAPSLISFTIAVDADQFANLAKLRALRRLWASVVAQCGATPRPARLRAETAFRMLTRRDIGVNMLRSTIAALAAGLGGADAITILPHTAALGLAGPSARRLARNTNLILLREAGLARMIDPACGAGGIEALTEALEAAAWGLFQTIEAAQTTDRRALPAVLENGTLAAAIGAMREARLQAIATRRTPITGVSEYPNLGEAPAEILRPAPPAEATGPFPGLRLAEPFEHLRDRAEALAPRPKIFLAPLGRLADFTPRAGFAKNAYEAGGIAVELSDGFALAAGGTDTDELLRAFRLSGARAACLVGADADYATEAVGIAQKLRAAGAEMLHLAGRPGELEPALNAAGISGYLALGMDLVAFLDKTLRVFEMPDPRGH